MSEHGLGDFKVGYHSIFHGTDGYDVARSATQHHLCLFTHCKDLACAPPVFPYRHYRRFAQDYAFAFYINQGIGGTQIYGQITGEPAQYGIQNHGLNPLLVVE
jgi:hypothetical protein